ncbi:hypothetical protein MHB85_20210 [Paenibacillus sp. FSL K6-4396]|uniref:hypothetical protein n=1 Tax=Paenibacillus sp. FSL K6-4396 TaxID=2921506 RepID=UPI0030FB2729
MAMIDLVVVQPMVTDLGLSTEVVRTVESVMMPQVGQKIRDRTFGPDTDLAIENVVIDYLTEECFVYLVPVRLNDADENELRNHAQEYERRGWEWPRPI